MPSASQLPEVLHWRFETAIEPGGLFYIWRWNAFDHAGELVMQSAKAFIYFSEAEADAVSMGYARPERRPASSPVGTIKSYPGNVSAGGLSAG